MSELTLTLALDARLDRRPNDEAKRSRPSLSAWLTERLARLLQVCPVCGHKGQGVRLISFDRVDGTCACPLTEDDERWLACLVEQGRLRWGATDEGWTYGATR